jgi:CO/xanthine dehydrogenase FAD-binding subunit
METAMAPDELLTGIVVPLSAAKQTRRAHYARFTPQSVADYPTVAVAASVTCDDGGVIVDAKVAIAGVASIALEVAAANILLGAAVEASDIADAIGEVARLASATSEPIDDRLGSALYKKAMASVWTERALLACITR